MKILTTLITILFLSLISFPSWSEIINLNLSCLGELSFYKDGKNLGNDKDFRKIIRIKNNIWDDRTQINLNISEDKIFKLIADKSDRVLLYFDLNRYTGELNYYYSEEYTGTDFKLAFEGICERLKEKKF